MCVIRKLKPGDGLKAKDKKECREGLVCPCICRKRGERYDRGSDDVSQRDKQEKHHSRPIQRKVMAAMHSNIITNKSSKCPEDGTSNFSISFMFEKISMILSHIIFPAVKLQSCDVSEWLNGKRVKFHSCEH